MQIKITYDRAMEFCPVEAQQAIDRLRKSRSKFRNQDPSTLPWEFFWGVEGRAESIGDLLSGRSAKREEAERKRSLEKRLEAHKRAIICSVCVKNYGAPLPRGTVPDEILNIELPCIIKEYEEEKRVEALTPEQRDEELRKLMQSMGMSPGFIAITLK